MRFQKFHFSRSYFNLSDLWFAFMMHFIASFTNIRDIPEIFSDTSSEESMSDSNSESSEENFNPDRDDATVWNSDDEIQFEELLASLEP